jgi:D-sedoheptulose 7-phosphate isomerase
MTRVDAVGAVTAQLEDLSRTAVRCADVLAEPAGRYARLVIDTFERGGRLLFCGNGGSAATVEHIATEYVIRLKRQREPLPAIALTAGSAQLTAAANDFGYERVFVRAVRAFGRPGDLLVLHSTSGDSPNLLAAAGEASSLRIATVALLGETGGRLAPLVDLPIQVPSTDTARIQEIHLAIEHAVADIVDSHFSDEPEPK